MRCKVPGTNDIRSKMVESKIGQVMTNKYCIYIYIFIIMVKLLLLLYIYMSHDRFCVFSRCSPASAPKCHQAREITREGSEVNKDFKAMSVHLIISVGFGSV